VKLRTLLGRTFTALAIAGLILSPLARPAVVFAAEIQAATVTEEHAMIDAGVAMPDMPCCPEKIPDCKKDCPLMALCMVNAMQAALQTPAFFVPFTLVDIVIPGNDAKRSGFAQPPPLGPPRA